MILSVTYSEFQTQNTIENITEYYIDHGAPSICLSVFKSNETSGYGCLIAKSKSFKDASKFCEANNMTLFSITSNDELKEVFSNARHYFGTGGGTVIWINGKWSARKLGWYDFPQHESFYLTERFNDLERYKGAYGRCLAIESPAGGDYEIKNFKCDNENYFYCKLYELDNK
jgi:hypothetical protein